MEKSCIKYPPKTSARPLFNFGRSLKKAIAWEKFF